MAVSALFVGGVPIVQRVLTCVQVQIDSKALAAVEEANKTHAMIERASRTKPPEA